MILKSISKVIFLLSIVYLSIFSLISVDYGQATSTNPLAQLVQAFDRLSYQVFYEKYQVCRTSHENCVASATGGGLTDQQALNECHSERRNCEESITINCIEIQVACINGPGNPGNQNCYNLAHAFTVPDPGSFVFGQNCVNPPPARQVGE